MPTRYSDHFGSRLGADEQGFAGLSQTPDPSWSRPGLPRPSDRLQPIRSGTKSAVMPMAQVHSTRQIADPRTTFCSRVEADYGACRHSSSGCYPISRPGASAFA